MFGFWLYYSYHFRNLRDNYLSTLSWRTFQNYNTTYPYVSPKHKQHGCFVLPKEFLMSRAVYFLASSSPGTRWIAFVRTCGSKWGSWKNPTVKTWNAQMTEECHRPSPRSCHQTAVLWNHVLTSGAGHLNVETVRKKGLRQIYVKFRSDDWFFCLLISCSGSQSRGHPKNRD